MKVNNYRIISEYHDVIWSRASQNIITCMGFFKTYFSWNNFILCVSCSFSCSGYVLSSTRPPVPVCLPAWLPLQSAEHCGADPPQHEEQPHQHDPHRYCHSRLPQHARVHPLQCPHVPAGPRRQGPRGDGELWDKSVYWIYRIMNNWRIQIYLFAVLRGLGLFYAVPHELQQLHPHCIRLPDALPRHLEVHHDQVPNPECRGLHCGEV